MDDERLRVLLDDPTRREAARGGRGAILDHGGWCGPAVRRTSGHG